MAVPESAELESVAAAYYRKAFALADQRDFDAAITTADAALSRFGASDDASVRGYVAACLDTKIYALRRLHRKDAASLVADQLVERFGADLDPDIEKLVARHAHRLGRSRSRLTFRGLG